MKKMTLPKLVLLATVAYFAGPSLLKYANRLPIMGKVVQMVDDGMSKVKDWFNEKSVEAQLAEIVEEEKQLDQAIEQVNQYASLLKQTGHSLSSSDLALHKDLLDKRTEVLKVKQELVGKQITQVIASKRLQLLKLDAATLRQKSVIADNMLSLQQTQNVMELQAMKRDAAATVNTFLNAVETFKLDLVRELCTHDLRDSLSTSDLKQLAKETPRSDFKLELVKGRCRVIFQDNKSLILHRADGWRVNQIDW